MPDQQSSSPSRRGLAIHEASRRLGVPAPTLRSWERRYALSATGRTTGGHRRYSEAALVELGMIRDEIAVGRPPADAARRVRLLLDERGTAWPAVSALLASATAGDARALRSVLDDAAEVRGVAAALDDVVLPSLRRLGSWWETGRCDVGMEQLAVAVVRAWLGELGAHAPRAGSGLVLLAVGPQDAHTVGVEALGTLLALQGTACRVLGSGTGAPALLQAIAACSPAAVVLVSHLASHRRGAVEALAAAADAGCPTFFAGNAFLLPRSRVHVAGSYLGESMAGAAEAVRTSLPGTLATPVLAPAV